MFDTLAYSQKLRAAGVPPDQADAHADALKAALAETPEVSKGATKSDLKDVETALRADLTTTETALRHDLQATAADLRHEIELVRRDMQAMENRIIIRITAVVVTTVVVTGAILGILTVLF
jgi:hypothetical protein